MSEQDVLDATQDFGDLDTQVCHRCAQHGRTDCDIESARQVLIQTARNITRDEVIQYLKTSVPSTRTLRSTCATTGS